MGGVVFNNTIDSTITQTFTKTNLITSDITTTTSLQGLQAQANAFSDSVGFQNAFVEADSFTQVDANGFIAEAAATSFAAGSDADQGAPLVIEEINLFIIQDATGSTDEDWVDAANNPVDESAFSGFDTEQNPNPSSPPEGGVGGPANEADVQDAIIAGIKNLLLTLAADMVAQVTADPDLRIEATVQLAKHFDNTDLILPETLTFSASGANDPAPGDLGPGDGLAEFNALFGPFFAELEDTGSAGETNFNEAYEAAFNFFDTLPTPDDDDPQNVLVQLTDVDPTVLTPTSQASVDAIDFLKGSIGLDVQVFIVEEDGTDIVGSEPDSRLTEIDSDGVLQVIAAVSEVEVGLV